MSYEQRQEPLRFKISRALHEYTGCSAAKIEHYVDPNQEGIIAVQAVYTSGALAGRTEQFLLYYGAPGMKGPYNGFEVEEAEFTTWPPTASSGGGANSI